MSLFVSLLIKPSIPGDLNARALPNSPLNLGLLAPRAIPTPS